ncbi:MAG: hypothetical protein JSU92_01150 [Deltaproteobacteria bacterium]|nr:MAG: hypothetical protein JSU92_01150 [Deltaproteobacteria bacterium]
MGELLVKYIYVILGRPNLLTELLLLGKEDLMSNTKAQGSNEIQSPNDKIKQGKSFDI